jgi:hypothetical protein
MKRDDRPGWFGPKRFGFGIHPQTWQGWLVVLALCAIILLAIRLAR